MDKTPKLGNRTSSSGGAMSSGAFELSTSSLHGELLMLKAKEALRHFAIRHDAVIPDNLDTEAKIAGFIVASGAMRSEEIVQAYVRCRLGERVRVGTPSPSLSSAAVR